MQKQNRVHPYSLPLAKSPLSHTSLVMPHLHCWCTAHSTQLVRHAKHYLWHRVLCYIRTTDKSSTPTSWENINSDIQRCLLPKAQGEILDKVYGLPPHWGYCYYVATSRSFTDGKGYGSCEKATGNCFKCMKLQLPWGTSDCSQWTDATNHIIAEVSVAHQTHPPVSIQTTLENIPPLMTDHFMHK